MNFEFVRPAMIAVVDVASLQLIGFDSMKRAIQAISFQERKGKEDDE